MYGDTIHLSSPENIGQAVICTRKSFATLTIFTDLQTLIDTFPYCSTLTMTVKHCWEQGLAVSTSIDKQIHTLLVTHLKSLKP